MSPQSSTRVRAYGVTAYGGPAQLIEVEVDREPLGPGQVRIQVTAATVNPTDVNARTGARAEGPRPASGVDVPGMDVAGRVVEVGADVVGFSPGDRVVALVLPSGEHGAYRTDVVVPASSMAHAPRGTSDAEAATLPLNGLTARAALDTLGLNAGDVVAITGAAGAVGGFAVQLATLDGLVVVADAAETDQELVRGLGADLVIPRGAGFAAAVREIYPDGVDGLLDASVQGAEVLPAVRDGSTVVTVRGYQGDGARGLRVVPVPLADFVGRPELLDRLRQYVEDQQLTLRVADVLSAKEVAEAHRRLEAGGVRGRLVLDLS